MNRAYPKDIQQTIDVSIEEELRDWMSAFDKANPNISNSARACEEFVAKELIRWFHEFPRGMSYDEIRNCLGIHVKSQEEIEREVLNVPHKTGFTVAELTGPNLLG